MNFTETQEHHNNSNSVIEESQLESPFIEANTEVRDIQMLKNQDIIPVFVKDNEPLISHAEFIDRTVGIAHHVFEGETITKPQIRVSHPVKGRIPEAKGKPANQLEDHEKTKYYERMAFVTQIPSITHEIKGDILSLTVGGVKAYNLDNLNRRKGAPEHFKVFIGFVNKVCTNLCVWVEGFSENIEVDDPRDLEGKIYDLVTGFSYSNLTNQLEKFQNIELSEEQFCQLIGRARLYQYLPAKQKKQLPELKLNDTQIATVAKEYYRSENFGPASDGSINGWDLYNLFTEANKSSYIDTFLDRSVNAYQFTSQIVNALEEDTDFWFLN
ncbi:DUF3871 family protein [Aliifodinibius salicampi]|uniref:DUF3871 family protein n=1 Tax=Fodinibius salicampi TaxID=1920655 RepID=A0ABT3PXU7_9BACT|nr:DUF3871 family protein [Fodinibius salicampi]MCW9712685.1 DUF3871 family protein [Fodinibius salicampi]